MGEVDVNLIAVIPAALVSGVLFGLIAVTFMFFVRQSTKLAASSRFSPLSLTYIAAVIVGTGGIFVPEALGLGTGVIAQIFDDHFTIGFLIILFFAKLTFTAICIGLGLFGGVFSPALLVGASAGAFLGKSVEGVLGQSVSAVMPICGMAAVASAVIGAPIAGVIIILELTMNYEFALAAMINVVMAMLFSNIFFGHSYFDVQLQDRGIDISQGRGHLEMMELDITSVISKEYVKLNKNATVAEAITKLLSSKLTEGYVVEKGTYCLERYQFRL